MGAHNHKRGSGAEIDQMDRTDNAYSGKVLQEVFMMARNGSPHNIIRTDGWCVGLFRLRTG